MTSSVALCTYNGARFIEEQINSIVTGTVLPDEIVICDDRSTDDTIAVIQRFADRTAVPIRVHVNAERLGSTGNFEKAILLCRYDIIFLCDQDDVWRERKVELVLDLFARDETIGGVFTDAALVDERLEPLGRTMFDYLGIAHFFRATRARDELFGRLMTKQFVTGATLAFRRSLVPSIVPFPKSSFFIHDGWLALTIAGLLKLRVIDQPLIAYRQHAAQQVGTMMSGIDRDKPAKPVVRYPLDRHEFARFYRELREQLGQLPPLREEPGRMLEEAIRHNDVRLSLAGRAKVMRPFVIARELLTGRYGYYSSGFKSAAKDLLYPQ